MDPAAGGSDREAAEQPAGPEGEDRQAGGRPAHPVGTEHRREEERLGHEGGARRDHRQGEEQDGEDAAEGRERTRPEPACGRQDERGEEQHRGEGDPKKPAKPAACQPVASASFQAGEVWVKSRSTGAQLQESGRESGAPRRFSRPARTCQ
ncbi:hypothetical protein G7075_10295 [Phycicoccus sp. HDW14]|uniref:hypothetical protein n=1 Tax=Phycicoccus sp. HDW14 TaxID=2714941 RepID=UPI00140BBCBE|nr:hypothetical protein [Phycicoccus sp. HDW14]QIM21422.1 hypothetical protein G7075_10295 [Phycicoccus sp. HDW14]